MGHYTIELSDADGTACKVKLSLPFAKNHTHRDNSTWRVLDEGGLKFRSGGCELTGKTGGPGHMRLCVANHYGIELTEFLDSWGIANDSGAGEIFQTFCTGFKPGAISWALLD